MRRQLLADHGMLIVLVLLCAYYSYATWDEQFPSGDAAAQQVAREARSLSGPEGRVLVVAEDTDDGRRFAEAAGRRLREGDFEVVATVVGEPPDLAAELERVAAGPGRLTALVASNAAARWRVVEIMPERFPSLGDVRVVAPRSHRFPDFLRRSNLLAIADRIVVIAIVAIGMTMVIITGGIDLSVGSLIALSAVLATVLIRRHGGAAATPSVMALACLGAVLLCGAIGAFSGLMVSYARIPPFIVTLAMMLVASGLAFTLAGGQSVYQVPTSIDWLGRGAGPFGLPNTVILMAVLYAAAHLLMTRTVLGRRIYAVGGNVEAARLSGVPVAAVILFVYTACGCLAGLGGIVQASQLRSGAPTYGVMYELYVIAAVVVGGSSLAGGRGRVLGTLIGAFIIAVIQNGMNLTGVESYTQKVVMGVVILAAVLLDHLRAWRR
ncbi:MAG: ABC transporter permease [Armatimonadetes bacterium]|nr:ABC transporter permease [Armatimonadota bacterium]